MHVGPLAPSFSLLHSGEIGEEPVTSFFSHFHTRRDAAAGRREQAMAVNFIPSALPFILDQILTSEPDANGAGLNDLLPNVFVPRGLRTVDGSYNNLGPRQQNFRAAEQPCPPLLEPAFRPG